MIIGTCPYSDCDEPFLLPIADRVGYQRWTCEHCQRVIWTRHSRVAPYSMTEEDFLATYDVDEATKAITRKPVPHGLGTLQ